MPNNSPAQTLLTDEEIQDIADGFDIYGAKPEFARAIESAVRSELRAPVADRQRLRDLVDVVWNEATESTAVPDTQWADRLIDKVFPSLAKSAPVAGEAVSRDSVLKEVAGFIRGTNWIAEEEPIGDLIARHVLSMAPCAAPQASEAVPNLPRGWQLALNLAIDAIENAAPAGQDWPVNWPAILHGLKELRDSLAQPQASEAGDEVTPEMLRAAQMKSELGGIACADYSGGYDLITELYQVMYRTALSAQPRAQRTGGSE